MKKIVFMVPVLALILIFSSCQSKPSKAEDFTFRLYEAMAKCDFEAYDKVEKELDAYKETLSPEELEAFEKEMDEAIKSHDEKFGEIYDKACENTLEE